MPLAIEELETAALSVIPDAVPFWIGLFETPPDLDGLNSVELTAAGYARVEVPSWLTSSISDENGRVSVRYNAEPVIFAEITEDTFARGLGLFTAAVGGDLKYWMYFEDSVTIPTGSEVNFDTGTLKIGFGDTLDPALEGFTVIFEQEAVTTDATPTEIAVMTSILDGEAVTIDMTITGKGPTGKHYWRNEKISYQRDDGGPGTELWTIRNSTVDGPETRKGFTTATASQGNDGNDVKVRVTGEAGTTIDWKVRAEIRYD